MSPSHRCICLVASAIVALDGSAANAQTAGPAPALEVEAQAAPRQRDPGRVDLPIAEAERVPGTGGDALKAIDSLPGFARPSFDDGKLILWGAAPGDTRVYIDGVEVPSLLHGGGQRGVLPGDLVRSIDVVPGAYGADYGRALGGIVRLTTKDLPAEGAHGIARADFIDASALATAAFADGKLRIALAGRVSYLDRLLSGVISPTVEELYPIPRYHDYQAKISLALREDESLDFVLLGSGDSLDVTIASPDPGSVRSESTASSFHRAWLRYTRTFEDGVNVTVTPFFGPDAQSLDMSFGPVPARQDETSFRYGLRADARIPFGSSFALRVGFDALGSTTQVYRTGSLEIPPREGDLYVFGEPPGASVNTDRWSTTVVDAAPNVSAEIKAGPVTIVPGMRLDGFLIDGSRSNPPVGDAPSIGFSRVTAAFDPRLSVSWEVSPRLTLSAAGGIYHQPPDPADMSAVFGTPALTLQRAYHASFGEAARLGVGFELEATAFYKAMDLLVVRSRLPDPTLAQALTQDGEGRSYGVQALLRRRLTDGVFGWVSYTLSRSERRYVDDATYRLFDDDQTHVLAVVASVERGGWGGGARFRATTGAPRTPVVGSYTDASSGQQDPIFGAQNSIRLPAFYQLDLRASRRFDWSRATLELSLDVLNVTFHRNVEEYVYSYDYSRRGSITGLPILAVLGGKVTL